MLAYYNNVPVYKEVFGQSQSSFYCTKIIQPQKNSFLCIFIWLKIASRQLPHSPFEYNAVQIKISNKNLG